MALLGIAIICIWATLAKPRLIYALNKQSHGLIPHVAELGVVALAKGFVINPAICAEPHFPSFNGFSIGLRQTAALQLHNKAEFLTRWERKPIPAQFGRIPEAGIVGFWRHPAVTYFFNRMESQPNAFDMRYPGTVISQAHSHNSGHEGRTGFSGLIWNPIQGKANLLKYPSAPRLGHIVGLRLNLFKCAESDTYPTKADKEKGYVWGIFRTKETLEITLRFSLGPVALYGGAILFYFALDGSGWEGRIFRTFGLALIAPGLGAFLFPIYWQDDCEEYGDCPSSSFHLKIVPRNFLTLRNYWGTLNIAEKQMSTVLNSDKQIAIIAALTEGSSIREIERMTGVHRDTIMRLGVKIGQGCTALMDATMRDLPCTRLEMDEIRGFVGKKEQHVRPNDDPQFGSVWTSCAIDAESKLVPAFRVGDRNAATANAFVKDVAGRMRTRVQISTDGLRAYVDAIETAFGTEVD